ncbi:MAG: putative deacylase [Patiriisocius sp.]|jgi:predicted deacylase
MINNRRIFSCFTLPGLMFLLLGFTFVFKVNAALIDLRQTAAIELNNTLKECQFSEVVFKANFEGARLDVCRQISDNTYLLEIDAESRPINPSPWYAFTVQSLQNFENTDSNSGLENKRVLSAGEEKDITISIIIKAIDARPRYLPKMQLSNGEWQLLDFTLNNSDSNGQTMEFTVTLDTNSQALPLKIAAQAIIDNQDYEDWTNKFIDKGLYQKVLIGSSTQGRPIHALVHQHSNNHEWLVLVGRMHPPELTGAVAFLRFAEQLNQTNPKMNAFYKRFNVLMVPNVNPDGVANGNWRHNTKGADLNRDWGKFEQVETRVVNDYLTSLLEPKQSNIKDKSEGKKPKLVFALDFHSTQQDIFYTMPNDYHVAPAYFSDEWLADVKANTVSSFVVRNRPGSSPGRGVFKQFIADTYNVHAVTYEMGDNTPNTLIKHVAQVSANTLVDKMLVTPASDFIYISNQSGLGNN